MVPLDVNVLVYAHREDSLHHQQYLNWLEKLTNSDHACGLIDLVLSGSLRIVTHPHVFNPPSSMAKTMAFAQELRDQPNCTLLNPGPRHREIFCRLCKTAEIKGNLVPDAFLAALAIESGREFVTADRDYHRFPGLRTRQHLEQPKKHVQTEPQSVRRLAPYCIESGPPHRCHRLYRLHETGGG